MNACKLNSYGANKSYFLTTAITYPPSDYRVLLPERKIARRKSE
jgi:hypothetical protein